MMCEGAGEAGASTGSFFCYLHTFWPWKSHTESKFTLFHNTGAVWLLWGEEMEKREQSGYERRSGKRGCGLS